VDKIKKETNPQKWKKQTHWIWMKEK